jgi:ATP-binding cassette subfamily F protein uup
VRRREQADATPTAKQSKQKNASKNQVAPQPAGDRRKRSYKDQRELDQLPQRIQQLESAIEQLHLAMGEPAYYQQPGEKIAAEAAKLAELEASLAKAYARWEELEA